MNTRLQSYLVAARTLMALIFILSGLFKIGAADFFYRIGQHRTFRPIVTSD